MEGNLTVELPGCAIDFCRSKGTPNSGIIYTRRETPPPPKFQFPPPGIAKIQTYSAFNTAIPLNAGAPDNTGVYVSWPTEDYGIAEIASLPGNSGMSFRTLKNIFTSEICVTLPKFIIHPTAAQILPGIVFQVKKDQGNTGYSFDILSTDPVRFGEFDHNSSSTSWRDPDDLVRKTNSSLIFLNHQSGSNTTILEGIVRYQTQISNIRMFWLQIADSAINNGVLTMQIMQFKSVPQN